MNEKQINNLMAVFYAISAIFVITGAFLKIQHSPYSFSVLIIGFMSGTVISSLDTYLLRKKIKKLEDQIKQIN